MINNRETGIALIYFKDGLYKIYILHRVEKFNDEFEGSWKAFYIIHV